MTDTPEGRRTKLGDPTDERTSDPIPDGEDILSRENPRTGETPRRYDGNREDDAVMPSNDSTLKTRI
jgi:hypothetical protein